MTESTARSAIDWGRVLAQIEQTLAQSLTLVGDTPPAAVPSATADGAVSLGPLARLDDRLERSRIRLADAERGAAEADEALASEAQALQTWLKALTASREKLAAWAARKV
jgi:hypothetical protein